jgi:DnaJ-class molecular chaperone
VLASRGTGDLLVTLDVVVPATPEAEQLAAIEALAKVSDGDALRAAHYEGV